jgi:hypothetical protein
MAKVGRFVINPSVGSYCSIRLDSGERILVCHEKAGTVPDSVTIQELRWWGFASGDTLLRSDLQDAEGQRILARLVAGAPPGSARATPLGAFVEYVKDARSVAEARTKCAALLEGPPVYGDDVGSGLA